MRTVAVASAAVLALTGCGGSRTASAPPAVTPAASQGWDTATLDACKEAKVFSVGSGGQKHADSARSSAALSDQQVLREVARRFETAPEVWTKGLDEAHAAAAAFEVSTWCINHRVPGSY